MSINPRYDTRLAGEVTRFHTWPRLREQSVAEHSWQLMRVIREVWVGGIRPALWEYVLYHDVAEVGVGDVPYPVKRNNPDLKEIMDRLEMFVLIDMGIQLPSLEPWEKDLMKACELIEMWEWAWGEVLRGNKMAKLVAERCLQAVHESYRDAVFYTNIVRYLNKRRDMWELQDEH